MSAGLLPSSRWDGVLVLVKSSESKLCKFLECNPQRCGYTRTEGSRGRRAQANSSTHHMDQCPGVVTCGSRSYKLKYSSTHQYSSYSSLELARVEDFSSNSYDRHYSDAVPVIKFHSRNMINQILLKWGYFTL